MRGFESGVKGEPTPDHKVKGGAFERGWIVGAIARKRELETAALYARLVLDSPAMAQARANAGDEPVAPDPLPNNIGLDKARSTTMRVPLSKGIAEVLALDEPSNRRGCELRHLDRNSTIEVKGTRMSLLLLWRDANARADGSFDQPAWYARSAKAACARLTKAIEYLDGHNGGGELVAPRGFWK
jgi:hypothetical protein